MVISIKWDTVIRQQYQFTSIQYGVRFRLTVASFSIDAILTLSINHNDYDENRNSNVIHGDRHHGYGGDNDNHNNDNDYNNDDDNNNNDDNDHNSDIDDNFEFKYFIG